MKEWDSGLNIVVGPTIEIHPTILTICDKIQSKFPKLEFSILVKGYPTEKGFYVTDDYVIPEQEVTGVTVDYGHLGEYQRDGYNVVIHSHHNMGTFFSKTDIDYINCNFPCSVLYTQGALTLATLSFQSGATMFLFEVQNISLIDRTILEIPNIENIKKKTIKATPKVRQVELLPEGAGGQESSLDCFQCDYKDTQYCLKCYEVLSKIEEELCLFSEEEKECIKCGYCTGEEYNASRTDEVEE